MKEYSRAWEDYSVALSACLFSLVVHNIRRLTVDLHYLNSDDSVRILPH